MSEIKPVAYMFDWMLEKDDVSVTHPDQLKLGTIIDPINVRPLYPAAALEALQEKLDRLNGLYHSEVSKHQLDCSVLQAVNASQAKRIEELEAATEHLGLTPQQAKDGLARYKAQVVEIATQAKRIEELEDRLSSFPIPTTVAMQKISKLRQRGFKEYDATVLKSASDGYCIVGDYGDVRWTSKNGE